MKSVDEGRHERTSGDGGTRHKAGVLLVPPIIGVVFAEVLLYVSSAQTGTTSGFFTPSNWACNDSGLLSLRSPATGSW